MPPLKDRNIPTDLRLKILNNQIRTHRRRINYHQEYIDKISKHIKVIEGRRKKNKLTQPTTREVVGHAESGHSTPSLQRE